VNSSTQMSGVAKFLGNKEVVEWNENKRGEIDIYRSTAPHDGFELLDTVDAREGRYETDEFFEDFAYYKLNDDLCYINQRPNPYAKEMMRRDQWFLKSYRHSGAHQGVVWIKNVNSDKCGTCWDEINEKRTISNCPDCLGTGLENPYYKPLKIYLGFSPGQRFNSLQPYKISRTDLTFNGWTTNIPLLKPDDILEYSGIKYRITRITPFTRVGEFIVRQRIVQIERIEDHRSEHNLDKEGLVEVLY